MKTQRKTLFFLLTLCLTSVFAYANSGKCESKGHHDMKGVKEGMKCPMKMPKECGSMEMKEGKSDIDKASCKKTDAGEMKDSCPMQEKASCKECEDCDGRKMKAECSMQKDDCHEKTADSSGESTEETGANVTISGNQKTCPVMGNPINKDIYVDYEGQRVYFCCPACKKTFLEDPEKYFRVMMKNGEYADSLQEKCPIMGNPVNEGSEAVTFPGRKVYICCPGCAGKVKENKEAAFEKISK